jgi:hypothetical protein
VSCIYRKEEDQAQNLGGHRGKKSGCGRVVADDDQLTASSKIGLDPIVDQSIEPETGLKTKASRIGKVVGLFDNLFLITPLRNSVRVMLFNCHAADHGSDYDSYF